MKMLFRRLWCGLILSSALFGGYWGMILTPVNRWAMYFSRLDFRAVVALSAAMGVLLGLGAWAIERLFPRAKPLLVASFWGWLALVLANNYPDIHKTVAQRMDWTWLTGPVWWLAVWTAGGLGTGCALVFPPWRRLAAQGWRFTRFFLWPLLFAGPFLAWQWPPLDAACGSGLDFARVPGNGRPATVVLLFDMLGYEGVFDETGNIRPDYANFAAFCERADVYHEADSAGIETATSIPGFIVQKRLAADGRKLRYTAADWVYTDGTNGVSAKDFAGESLPALARAAGGRAQSIGMYVPWDELVPGLWNATESMALGYGNHGVHVFGQPPSFRKAAVEHLAWYFFWVSKSPLAALFRVTGLASRKEAQAGETHTSLVARGARLLRESLSPGDFLLLHVDMPHDPYLIGRGGAPLPPSLHYDDVAGLAAQTGGADWALGEWLDAIAASPAGRDAWIIVTSDHGVHKDRYRKGRKTHVPFLVHRPGQTERRDIAEPADLADLRSILPGLPPFADGTP